MWWAGSELFDLYLGTRAVAVCKGGEVALSRAVPDLDAALAALSVWLGEAPACCRLRVWLSGGLCRPFIVPAVPGVRGALEWQRSATALAARHTGLPEPCRVWVDAARDDAPRVAVAVQESLIEQLLALINATGKRRSLISLRPWWAEVQRAARAREPQLRALATQDCDSLTVLVGEPGDKKEAFALATTLTPLADRDAADSALARLLLSVDVGDGEELVGRLMPVPMLTAASAPTPTRPADLALSALAEFSR